MEENNILTIQCPNCKKNNGVKLSKPIECYNCQTILTKKKISNSVAIVVFALITGIGAGKITDDIVEQNRYPVDVEYRLVNSCVESAEKPLSYSFYYQKQSICECALVKTQNEFDYAEYELDKKSFMKSFEKNVVNCLRE